jgi:hypothetical protein
MVNSKAKKFILFLTIVLCCNILVAGIVEKTFRFGGYKIESAGDYQTLNFGNTQLYGLPGEPVLPYHEIFLMLPPGEAAVSIELTGEEETVIPGTFVLYPKQEVRPISMEPSGKFIKNESIYKRDAVYPANPSGHLTTQYLNGFAFALCTFTPVKYIPLTGKISYYQKITVRIITKPDPHSSEALKNLPVSGNVLNRVRTFAQNPEMTEQYPSRDSPMTTYQYLIITPALFQNEFQQLISMYSNKGIVAQVMTVQNISASVAGIDLQDKIRNYIKDQYTNHGVEYVLLAGNPQHVPYRGFYCHVISGGGYTDYNIPADLYYSGMDGTYDANGNHIFGEVADAVDLLPDIAVARMPVNDTAELRHMIHKSVFYQTNPVLAELTKPLMIGEWLYGNPLTMGGDYMNLLINNHGDHGYYTHGIPSASNSILKLYDTVMPSGGIWSWSTTSLLSKINSGRSFLHHLGHANSSYVMRLNTSDITNANFPQVDGFTHNYQLLYTQGCDCGDFTVACIGSKMVTIANFLAGGVFNSRYGWFDEGTTEGPSEHLHREFVSALYRDTLPDRHLGNAHMISKIKTAPWVDVSGEFEPGAQRWCHYDANVFGDPALEIWTTEPSSFTVSTWTGSHDTDWNYPGNWSPASVPTSLNNAVIPNVTNQPVITTLNTSICHDLIIQSGSSFKVNAGKSVVVRGSVILN